MATRVNASIQQFHSERPGVFRLVECEHQGLSRVILAPTEQFRSKNQQPHLHAISASCGDCGNCRLVDEERDPFST
jgi:ferredoxin-like protein FixX